MKTDSVDLDGQTIFYGEWGDSKATRTLLLFNGIGANVETLSPFSSRFLRHRVISFDVPGVGRSPAPAVPYRFSNIARLAAKLLDHLGICHVAVFGVSWGGGLAQQFAYDFPERTHGLILAATSAGYVMWPGKLGVLARMVSPKRYSDTDYMSRIGPEIYGGLLRENGELLKGHMASMSRSSPLGYLYQLLAIAGWSSWGWLPRISTPALVLMGRDDPIVPLVNGRILAGRLADARLQEIDCGHLFIITQPAGTARIVEDFLCEVS